MPISFSDPVVYESTENKNTHTISLPAAAEGDLLVIVAQLSFGDPTNSTPSGFSFVVGENASDGKDFSVYAKVAGPDEPTSVDLVVAGGASSHINAHSYLVTGATSILAEIYANDVSDNGFENPNFNPPSLTAGGGSQEYGWLTGVFAEFAEGFSGGPTNYTSTESLNTDASPSMALGTAFRVLEAETEDPGAFTSTSTNNVSSTSFTVAISPSASGPQVIRKSSTFDIETGLSGTVTSATLDGNAITVDSQTGTTVTLTDSDGSITTSGEYDLVLTDDSADPDETIVVQVNVYGVVPSNNPWQKEGSALASLTNVQYRVVNGSALNGTQLHYTGTGTTDASGNIPTFDVSDTGAAVDDAVHIVGLTANGESIVAPETVELI